AACHARRGPRCAGASDHDRRRGRVAGMKAWDTLRYERRGALAIVSLDRPDCLNAYSVAMRDELHAVLAAADVDPAVRVLVLRGRGPAFSTGGGLREVGSAAAPLLSPPGRAQRH